MQNLVVFASICNELVNLVLVPCEVVANLPTPVSCLDGTPVGGKLETGVVQRTDIAGHFVGEVGTYRNYNRVDKVCCLAMVEVEVQ